MKHILLTLTLATLFTSCGALNDMCGSDLRMGCNTVFGELPKDYDDRLDNVEDRLDDVEVTLVELFNRDAFLASEIRITQSAVKDNQINIGIINAELLTLRDTLADHGFRIGELESNMNIKSVIRPCTFAKEVLLQFDNGTVLAYFENGNNRYLSEISTGSYITTDGTGCRFSVSASGEVTSN